MGPIDRANMEINIEQVQLRRFLPEDKETETHLRNTILNKRQDDG
jgi:hypothetical protein